MGKNVNLKLLQIDNLRTWFPLRHGILSRVRRFVRAVDGVSLAIDPGETLGLVGESGCGKTTLGRTIVGLERAREGQILFRGKKINGLTQAEMRPVRRELQMIFQDPFSSLNPRMTVMDIITEALAEHGLLSGARDDAAAQLLREVGLDPASVHRYPHEFSGGQRQRISVARAVGLGPSFIVCDECVSALDVSVQAQVINLLMDLRDRYGLAYLFISHDLSVVRHISHRIAVMYLGQIVEEGPARKLIDEPLHPYTCALVSAIPVPGKDRTARIVLRGEIPSPVDPPPGCRFHPRCPRAMDKCRTDWPHGRRLQEQTVHCHLYE